MIKRVCFFLFMAVVLSGCRSDLYYQNRAVERARKYLLANCDDLSVDEMYFVRYNAPLLLHAPVLGDAGRKLSSEKLESELKQVCVTWMIPGRKDLYMVFGVSRARMDDWYPNRLLVRDYRTHTPVLAGAVQQARSYAQNNFYQEMSDGDIGTVRFTFPFLLRTDFELNFDAGGSLNAGEIAALREKSKGQIQYSLVWKLNGGNLVFAGLAEPGFKNWRILMAQFISGAELDKHTQKVVMTPENGLDVLPESEKTAVAEVK